MILGVSAALLGALVFGVIAAVQASVIRRHGLRSPMMLVVLAGYLVGWALHLVAIAQLPLYLAQVGVGTSLIVSALIASFVMGESLRGIHWTAIGGMVLGLGVLSLASGDVGTSHFTDTTTIVLYSLLVTTSVAGWLAWRWQHPLSGILLAVLSGVAYGISPIATRALVDFHWDLNTYATAVSIGLYGGIGFVLYSLAFQRTSVTAATAPQTLLQTAIPAAVGIALFDDEVRTGWWGPGLIAFGLAMVAGIVLCSTEARLLMAADGLGAELGEELEGLAG
ncbi:MAG: hypothetical protein NTV23_14705 [Propionibacteriales bacterium]|nr:hypothetical protein [Propionibacteriales bacterium]